MPALRRVEEALLAAIPAECEPVTLAPLVPLGTHSAIAPVSQDWIVPTVRGQETAADPTNGLALEAAVRRLRLLAADPRSAEMVRLATVQRVVRGQRFEGPDEFAHFALFGKVTAGRDTGHLRFEGTAVAEHARFLAAGLRAAGAEHVLVEVSDLTGGAMASVVETALDGIADVGGVTGLAAPDRERARGYYDGLAIRTEITIGDATFEVADGGLVDWTQQLVGSRKERLMISGIGIDRIALALVPDSGGPD
jgi:hypothetical protein